MPAVALAVLVIAALNLALAGLIAGHRWRARRRARRHDRLVGRLRRPALEFLADDETTDPPQLDRQELKVFAELLAGYGRVLRGPDRARIVAFAEAEGIVDEQLRRLRSLRAWRRATAAFALGDVGAPGTAPALVARLDDRSPDVRAAACRSLGHLGSVDTVDAVVTAGVSGRVPGAIARLALLDIGPAALTRLLALCEHERPEVRAAAVQLVGLLGDPAVVDAIVGHLADPAAAVRAATAAALGRLGASQERDALVGALADRIPTVRTAAATALGEIGGRRASDALVPMAREDGFEPARAAAEALAHLDPDVVRALAERPGAGPHLREAAGRVAL